MKLSILYTATLTAVLNCTVPCAAGVAESPLPQLEAGKTTLHLYTVPGVMGLSCFGTYFYCTSTDTAAIRVGIEVFAGPGGGPVNDAVVSSLSVAPGATASFGTATPLDFGIQSHLGAGGFNGGSARILSTSKKVICTAFVADRCFSPVTFMNHLTIIAKTKQKAAN